MLPLIRVEEYVTREGFSPFADWFGSLHAAAAARVNTYLTRLSQGNISGLKPIKGAFQEVVIHWGPGYRIYIGRDGNTLVILLGGGTKKRQARDIVQAEKFWQEYKARKAEAEYGDYTGL